MKTMIKDNRIGRFDDQEAQDLKDRGWTFCPKWIWKNSSPPDKPTKRDKILGLREFKQVQTNEHTIQTRGFKALRKQRLFNVIRPLLSGLKIFLLWKRAEDGASRQIKLGSRQLV